MRNINHSWKGLVHIDGTDYHWEQFATKNPTVFKVIIFKPVEITFEFAPHQNSIGYAIAAALKVLK